GGAAAELRRGRGRLTGRPAAFEGRRAASAGRPAPSAGREAAPARRPAVSVRPRTGPLGTEPRPKIYHLFRPLELPSIEFDMNYTDFAGMVSRDQELLAGGSGSKGETAHVERPGALRGAAAVGRLHGGLCGFRCAASAV